jgi:Asp-tRNA(Asn)/Glu-tRNA(Gln) amidotransferase A subunit family amidase
MGPDVGEGWGGMAVSHAITRTVRDSAALLDATAGPDVGDPYWAPPPARPFRDKVGVDPGRLRIAVCTEPWNGSPVDAECKEAVAAAAKLCTGLGHVVDEARPKIDVRGLMEAQRMIVSSSTRMLLEMRAGFFGREPKADDVEAYTWRVATYGSQVRAVDYARSMIAVHEAPLGRDRVHVAVQRERVAGDVRATPLVARRASGRRSVCVGLRRGGALVPLGGAARDGAAVGGSPPTALRALSLMHPDRIPLRSRLCVRTNFGRF